MIGSSNALRYQESPDGGSIVYRAQPDVFDDGPAKPCESGAALVAGRFWQSAIPTGDTQMLQFAGSASRPALRLLILHDEKTASSTTPPAPNTSWISRRHKDGRSSASRRIGRPYLPLERSRKRQGRTTRLLHGFIGRAHHANAAGRRNHQHEHHYSKRPVEHIWKSPTSRPIMTS